MTVNLDTRRKRPHFFANPEVDALMTALLETMSQAWVTREREAEIDAFQRDEGET